MAEECPPKQGLQGRVFGRSLELPQVDRTRLGDGSDDGLQEFLEQGPQAFREIFFDQFGRHAFK